MSYLTEKNRSLLKNTWNILYKVVLVFLIITAGLILLSSFNIPGNIKLFTVQSGSMEPAIGMGALIVVKPMDEYRVGDIINISEPANPGVSVTHRIVDIEIIDDQVWYVTKGDANEDADTEKRPAEDVVGKVIFSLPLLGYLVNFAKTREGLLLLIILPAVFIVANETVNIGKETKKILKTRSTKHSTESKISKTKAVKLLVIICTAMSIGTLGTKAYLADMETSLGNTISAGIWEIQKQKVQIFNSIKLEPFIEEAPETISIPEASPTPSMFPSPTPEIESKPTDEAIIIFSVTMTPTPTIDLTPEIQNSLEE